jgi:hypothetical protein
VLALACNSLVAVQKEHINTSVEIISRNYSADLRNLILLDVFYFFVEFLLFFFSFLLIILISQKILQPFHE